MTDIAELAGKTLVSATNLGDEEIVFETASGELYKMSHSQDCCESVTIESIVGDLEDLIGSPIVQAEEVTYSGGDGNSSDWPEGVSKLDYSPESYTWTFYKLATNKGGVTIRWLGESNGYYSESVDFYRAAN